VRRAAIVSPLRTPVGTFGGALRDVPVGGQGLVTMCVGGGQGLAATVEAA
jgi:acetyl-CoA acetyltransferase